MKLIRSFGHAWHGIQYCYKTQLNFRIHLWVLLMVIIAASVFKISLIEWLIIIGCSILVMVLELVNTAIEHLCDTITKDFHPAIKIIKDVSAAAVLIAAAGSVVIGAIIFFPKIIAILKL
jgi:diacylglycerol kinase